MTENADQEVPWPNQQEPLDCVIPTGEISQDPDLFVGDEDDPDQEMED